MINSFIQRNLYVDLLKTLAIFFMIIDHIGHFLLPDDLSSTLLFRGVGRLAMPLFFIAHGYLLASTLAHPPILSRIVKFITYGLFLTITFIILGKVHGIDILITFALIEIIWLFGWRCGKLSIIISVFTFANCLLVLNFISNLINLEDIDYVAEFIQYGVFPLYYSVAGAVLGYRPYNNIIQILAVLLLVTTVSFQYNLYIYIAYSLVIDLSYFSYILPSLIIPILFYYLPKQSLEFPVLGGSIQQVSCYALPIYVIHLQIIAIILILFRDIFA